MPSLVGVSWLRRRGGRRKSTNDNESVVDGLSPIQRAARDGTATAPHDEERSAKLARDRKRAYDRVSFVLLTVILWATLRFAFGTLVSPNGPAKTVPGGALWSMALIWGCSHIGGASAQAMGLPSLIGMLLSGLLLRNVPGGLVDDLPEKWSSDIRAAGLSVILMRSGLELDLNAFRSIGWAAARLTVMPGLSEAITCGLFSMLIFKMTFPLGMCLGFILGAVSPAVVVLGMFELQSRGYGVEKGIPSLIVAAASFDDVVAITGYTIFKSFALGGNHDGGMAWTVLHGPTDVLLGLVVGTLGGMLCGITKVWDIRWKRTSATFMLGIFFMFLGRNYGFNGGGAMASLALGISANKCWSTNKPHPRLTTGPSVDHAHGVEHDLSKLWRFIFQPLLFGVIGAAVNFKDVTPSTIPKSIGLLCIGLVIRLPMAFVAVAGGKKPLTFIERLFVALAWIPKATVQAALASDPLDFILAHDKGDKYVKWGNDILTTAVFSIILTAPLGMMIISVLGPKWLQCDLRSAAVVDGDAGADLMEKVELQRRNSIEQQARRTSVGDGDGRFSLDGGSPRAEVSLRNISADAFFERSRDGSIRDREGSVIGSVISDKDSQPALKNASANEKLLYHLATLRELASDSPDISPEELALIEQASAGIEDIMREHMPRNTNMDTAGLFFRRTSATFADLDLPAPGEFDDIIADVEVVETPERGDDRGEPASGDERV